MAAEVTQLAGPGPGLFDVYRFDPGAHGSAVYDGFTKSYRDQGLWLSPRVLKEQLVKPGVVALVALSPEATVMGFVAALPRENRLVYAYTKHLYRRRLKVLRDTEPGRDAAIPGVMTTLAIAGGIDFTRDVACSFWSRAAEAIAAKPGNPYRLTKPPEWDGFLAAIARERSARR